MAIADVGFRGFLTREHQEHYHRDGFVTLRDVFPREEMAGLEREADRLFQRTDLIDSDNN